MIEINKPAYFVSVDGKDDDRTFTLIKGKIVGHTFDKNKKLIAYVLGVTGWDQPIILAPNLAYPQKKVAQDALDDIIVKGTTTIETATT